MYKGRRTVLFNDEYYVEEVPVEEFKEMWEDYGEETYVVFCNEEDEDGINGRSTYYGTYPHLEKALERVKMLDKEGERAGKEQADCWYDACMLRVRSIEVLEDKDEGSLTMMEYGSVGKVVELSPDNARFQLRGVVFHKTWTKEEFISEFKDNFLWKSKVYKAIFVVEPYENTITVIMAVDVIQPDSAD